MTLPIVTERLVLRRYTYGDIPNVLQLASQPSVAKEFSCTIQATEEGVRTYIDQQNSYQPFEKEKVFELAIERQEDGKVIGLVGMIREDHGQAEIGWAIGVEHRGQGYATEAARALMAYGFTSLGLHRIHADTSTDNLASWRIMERLGMRREGLLREAVYEEGKWANRYIYSMLADEWRGTGAPSQETEMGLSEGNRVRVLGIIGSPRRGGNTEILVDEVLRGAEGAGALTEKVISCSLWQWKLRILLWRTIPSGC